MAAAEKGCRGLSGSGKVMSWQSPEQRMQSIMRGCLVSRTLGCHHSVVK